MQDDESGFERTHSFFSKKDFISKRYGGRHGKKYKEKDYFTKEYDNIELIIAESENMFFTPDSLEYYTKNGRQVEWRPSKISILGE